MDQVLSTGQPTIKGGQKLDAYTPKEIAKLTGYGLNTVYIHIRAKNEDGSPKNFPNLITMGKRKLVTRQDFIAFYGYDPNPERNRPTQKVAKYDKPK